MRAAATLSLALVVVTGALVGAAGPASASPLAGDGYSSSYAGESVFEDRAAGESAQLSAIFFNDGSQPWLPGVVGLLVCLADKVTCNVPSPNAAYASGWYSATVYATVTSTVAPGQNGFFIYRFTVPAGTPGNTVVTFDGDVGLIATGAELRPEGYYQQNTTPPYLGSLTISPISASLRVGGQQRFTATTDLVGSIRWTVQGQCGGIDASGTFTAIALSSAAQPCSVVASAGTLTASATVTVFGTPASLSCSASPASVVANGGVAPDGVSTVTVTVDDANGNAVTTSSLGIVVTNGSPALDTLAPVGGAIAATNGVATLTVSSTLTVGQIAVALTAPWPVTGCTALIPSVAAGPPAELAASFTPSTIGADGVSTSTLRVDVEDARGDRTADGATTVDVVLVSDGRVCALAGVTTGAGATAGATGYANDVDGRIELSVKSTLIEGTCAFNATARGGSIAGSSATLTTKFVGQPVRLVVAAVDPPRPAGSASLTNVTVAILDGAGTQVSRSALPIAATLAGNCTGAGGGDVVLSSTGATSGGQAAFQLTSNGAYAGCAVIFTANGVSPTQASIAFLAGPADHLGCSFLPSTITANGSSTAAALVTVLDQLGNGVASGSYTVLLSRTGGDGVTLPITTRAQITAAGIASFQIRSVTTSVGADVYTPSLSAGTLPRVSPDRTCVISAGH